MSSSSSNEERNFGDCSPFESSSSMDERSSMTLEALLREHDEDSTITEFSLPKIRATFCIPGDFDLLGRYNRELVSSSSKGSEAYREFVGSWSRVSEAYREFTGSLPKKIRSLLGCRQGVCLRKTKRLVGRSSGVVEKLAGS
ncbi:hypothetical protein BHM03_00017539 [Ensete ventricosum]|nr:hypothetical protein BHM03_00017539 [Ensete ventricosum]